MDEELHLRRFTDTGLTEASQLLDDLDAGKSCDVGALLISDTHTELLSDTEIVDVQDFQTRRQLAEYFHGVLAPYEQQIPDIERDTGLWTWLSIAWLDILAPPDSGGTRPLRDRARLIPAVDDYRKYYRHLLAGPYRIFRAHLDDPDRAMAVLATPPNRPGDLVEQLASRQEVITNQGLLAMITGLYYDGESERLKRGAARKDQGGVRRLVNILGQLDLTWDIYGMGAEALLALLPDEFDEFRTHAPHA